MLVSGRWKRWSLLGLLASLGTALFVISTLGFPDGFVTALHAVDDGGAVVLFRANYANGPSRAWVARVDPDRGVRWCSELPDLAIGIGPYGGMSVGSDLVTVRTARYAPPAPGSQGVTAHALSDGRRLWRTELTSFNGQKLEGGGFAWPGLEIYVATLFGGDRLFEFASDGTATSLYVLDRLTGKRLREYPAPSDVGAPIVTPHHVVLHESFTAHVIDPTAQHPARAFATLGLGLVASSEYVTARVRDGHLALLGLDLSDPDSARVICDALDHLSDTESVVRVARCGRLGESTVLTLRQAQDEMAVVVVDPSCAVRARIPLGRSILPDGPRSTAMSYPDAAPLSGTLTRFVPLIVNPVSASAESLLTMIDLESGKIAWQTPPSKDLSLRALFRAGGHYILALSSPAMVVAFDGGTGQLTAAISTQPSFEIPEPYHVAAGHLWLFNSEWADLADAPLAVVDVATLVPIWTNQISIVDVTQEARTRLGR